MWIIWKFYRELEFPLARKIHTQLNVSAFRNEIKKYTWDNIIYSFLINLKVIQQY